VRQIALKHVTDDFHIAMAMGAETGARRDAVFIDDTQVAPAHVLGVVVSGEREAVVRLEPAMVCITPVSRFAQRQHGHSLLADC
jgi:hypothetical protein